MSGPSGSLTPTELGVIEVLLLRFNKYQIPRLIDIKKSVDRGEPLGETDQQFLHELNEEIRSCEHFLDLHADYRQLFGEVSNLFTHIMHKAKENNHHPG